jgi:hypothetical protein
MRDDDWREGEVRVLVEMSAVTESEKVYGLAQKCMSNGEWRDGWIWRGVGGGARAHAGTQVERTVKKESLVTDTHRRNATQESALKNLLYEERVQRAKLSSIDPAIAK